MVTSMIVFALLSIVSAVVSAVAYEYQRYRLAVITEMAAAMFGFLCGCLFPLLLIEVLP